MKAATMIALFMMMPQWALAHSITVSTTLQFADSKRLYDAMAGIGHTIGSDDHDPSIVIHQVNFESDDGALAITCRRLLRMGLELGNDCEINIDESLAQPSQTKVSRGIVADVVAIELTAPRDVSRLGQTITRPLGYFQSTEKVSVILADGRQIEAPKLRADCSASSCRLTLIP